MVLGAAGGALAAAAGGVSAVWGYNRDNYMYDREMRQKNEFKVATFRSKQANLWREDVRDLIALTERKMDSYLVVNTLQLAMCVGLFTEGRLKPGTPQWLLRFYMCTLGAAFMYLLMSMWLAMHASVVAQTSGVRILTQLVRLPIPTWQQLEAMRSYAASYEKLGRSMLRIPFISRAPAPMSSTAARGDAPQKRSESDERSLSPQRGHGDHKQKHSYDHGSCKHPASHAAAISSSAAADAKVGTTSSSGLTPDPWELERSGSGIYELQNRPNASRPHIGMVRREALHWQCYDAFARVSMSFGTNQLLYAITYYCLGYVTIEDGALWPAVCIAAVMKAIAVTLVHLDFAITRTKLRTAIVLLLAGPFCVVVTTWALLFHSPHAELISKCFLPVAYLSHSLWLLWSLKALKVERHLGGAWLPMNFRTVLYLDVFGWFHHHHQRYNHQPCRRCEEKQKPMIDGKNGYRAIPRVVSMESTDGMSVVDSTCSEPVSPTTLQRHKDKLMEDVELWQLESVQTMMEPQDKERVSKLARQFHVAVGQDASASSKNLAEPDANVTREALTAQSSGDPATDPPSSPQPLYVGSAPAASSSGGRKQQAQWVRLTGQTDFGTVVPYLYNPQTGDIRTMEGEDSLSRSVSDFPRAMSMTETEEHVQRFVRRAEKLRNRQEAQLQTESAPSSTRSSEQDATGIASAAHDVVKQAAAWSCTPKVEEPPRSLKQKVAADQEANCSQCDTKLSPGGVTASRVDSTLPLLDAHSSAPEIDHFHGPATDYGKVDPGKLPWLVFRFATLLLVGLWTTGPFLSFGFIGGMAEFGYAPLLSREGETGVSETDVHGDVGVDKIISAALTFETDGSLPAFADGEEVRVSWPRGSSFIPRSLSCDPLGKQLVVSDDFGVYSAQLSEVQNADLPDRKQTERRLRGQEDTGGPVLEADFSRVLPCTALEGQAVKDIGVVCSEGQPSVCMVLVLHSRGHRLAECPLLMPEQLQSVVPLSRGMLAKQSNMGKSHAGSQVVEPLGEWTIPGSWLNLKGKKEHVESIAVNNECLSRARMLNGKSFDRDMSGCVAVGTTSGRVVQMRRHVTEAHQLVPEWNMVQLPHSIGQGSLHVVPGEFVLALHTEAAVVRAFNAVKGDVLGTWQLPEEIRWITLCGGGGSIYMLGVQRRVTRKEDGQRVMLWRFPVPPELRVQGLLTRDYSKAGAGGQEI